MTCSSTSAKRSSSRVALKASIRWVGSLRMKPTVSESSTSVLSSMRSRLVVVSSVSNSRSLAGICEPVRQFKSVDLPALV